jgi:exodeoxyribonuclease VII large subunit
MLEKRRVMLAGEGLFDAARKKPLPYLPEIIGVVTSPSGAVIRDILHRLRDRFPRKVLVWPVAVQGQKCAAEVAAAIDGFNRLTPGGALPRPDLIIVARGGGSLEDLWGFNEEIVVRAAAASDIPLISAVGHETDTTLIDFAADIRAPTPTAAAELAVPVRIELLAFVDQQGARLVRALSNGVQTRRQRLRDLARALPQVDTLVDGPRQRLDYLSDRLPAALRQAAAQKRLQLSDAALRPAILQRRLAEDRRRLAALADRLAPALQRRTRDAALTLDRAGRGLRPDLLQARLDRQAERLGSVLARLSDRATRQQAERTARLAALDRLRETLGYMETLKRGYAVVRTGDVLVTDTVAAAKADHLEIQFADGRITVQSGR